MIETQDALGHKNSATTQVYVNRIAVKRGKHSKQITARLKIRRTRHSELLTTNLTQAAWHKKSNLHKK